MSKLGQKMWSSCNHFTASINRGKMEQTHGQPTWGHGTHVTNLVQNPIVKIEWAAKKAEDSAENFLS